MRHSVTAWGCVKTLNKSSMTHRHTVDDHQENADGHMRSLCCKVSRHDQGKPVRL